MAEAKFLGIKQSTLAEYIGTSDAKKANYLWLVREFAADDTVKKTPVSVAVYFGTRKYAETNQVDTDLEMKVNAIIKAIGGSVDAKGEYQGFLPIEGDSILSGESVSTLTIALQKLSQAITENKESAKAAKDAANTAQQGVNALKEKVGSEASEGAAATGIFAKIDEIEKKLDPEGSLAKGLADVKSQIGNVSSDTIDGAGILGDIEKLQKSDEAVKEKLQTVENKFADYYTSAQTYTQEQINEKLTSLLRWKGSLANLDAIKAVTNPEVGDVYHSNADDAEYVFIGGEDAEKQWEFLGVNVSLKGYVTETALDTKLADYAKAADLNALSAATKIIETTVGNESKGLVKDVTDLQNRSTRIVKDYQEAESLTDLSAGQIVYAKSDYTKEPAEGEASGKTYTAGAYLVTGVDETTKVPSFLKIESSATGGQTPVDLITNVDNKVNNLSTIVNNNKSAITNIENTLKVSGDDVEVVVEE